jgi:hypothetical protein
MKNNRKLFWLTLSVSLALGALTAIAWWTVGARELDQYPKEFSFENIRQIDFQCALEYYSVQSRN